MDSQYQGADPIDRMQNARFQRDQMQNIGVGAQCSPTKPLTEDVISRLITHRSTARGIYEKLLDLNARLFGPMPTELNEATDSGPGGGFADEARFHCAELSTTLAQIDVLLNGMAARV